MNKLIDITRATISPALNGYETQEIGNKLHVKLDDTRRVEVYFRTTGIADNYDAIQLKLVSKTNGEIDALIVRFEDIFSCMQDMTHPNRIGKHIWVARGKYDWYGKPTAADIAAIRKSVRDYVELWK